MDFAYATARVGTDIVFHLAGELDLAHRDELAAALISALPDADTVIADHTNLTIIDGSGLSTLLRCRHHAATHGGHITVRDAQGCVARVLD